MPQHRSLSGIKSGCRGTAGTPVFSSSVETGCLQESSSNLAALEVLVWRPHMQCLLFSSLPALLFSPNVLSPTPNSPKLQREVLWMQLSLFLDCLWLVHIQSVSIKFYVYFIYISSSFPKKSIER